jgi:hypothetical protein
VAGLWREAAGCGVGDWLVVSGLGPGMWCWCSVGLSCAAEAAGGRIGCDSSPPSQVVIGSEKERSDSDRQSQNRSLSSRSSSESVGPGDGSCG